MTLFVTPRTENSHEVGGEFPNDHLHLFVCRFPKDSCERGVPCVRHDKCVVSALILCRSTKRRCFVCSDDNTYDTNQKGIRKTIRGCSVGGNVGDGDAGDNCNGTLNCWFCCKFEFYFHSLGGVCVWDGHVLDVL